MLELGRNISIDSHLNEWFYGFMNRWKDDLKLVKDVKLEKVRSTACTKEVVVKWFAHLKDVLTTHNLFNRPDAIWNVDESGFTDDPGRKQVVVTRSNKHPTSSHSGSGKSHTTVLICASAIGECLPPYLIHRGVRLYDIWCPKNGFPGTRYNVSPTGWVEEPIFFDWFSRQFLPAIKSIKRPVILIYDGHYTHISTRIIKMAMNNDVIIECLPPHTTTILQPLDLVTLTKVKTAWRQLLRKHNLQTNSAPIDKVKFALLIKELWENHLLKSHCQGGFSRAGIFPFDPRAVSTEKLLSPPSSVTLQSNQTSSITQSDTDDILHRQNHSSGIPRTINRSSSCINLSTNGE
ncbi:unnamed protein product [Rotaria sp. Silwood2]|nr:unnamed protein product [Rotaria sp. Silwood2]